MKNAALDRAAFSRGASSRLFSFLLPILGGSIDHIHAAPFSHFFAIKIARQIDMHPKSWTLLEVHIFMSGKKRINKKYSAEFKISVIMDMRKNRLSYHEAVRKFGLGDPKVGGTRQMIKRWERIYLEEGAAGLMTERRGKKAKGRPRKKPLDKEIENDLIAENQRLKERNQYLEAELECIKKLSALVIAEEQEKSKKH